MLFQMNNGEQTSTDLEDGGAIPAASILTPADSECRLTPKPLLPQGFWRFWSSVLAKTGVIEGPPTTPKVQRRKIRSGLRLIADSDMGVLHRLLDIATTSTTGHFSPLSKASKARSFNAFW
jgi:hypothetical protein